MKHIAWLLMMVGTLALAQQEPLVFDSVEQQERFNRLTEELRCLVCQNQSLADSDAPLAHDLREEVYDMMQQGLDDDAIKQFVVERYGDFVLYRPPVQGNTLLLWGAPAVLLLIGFFTVSTIVRRRSRMLTEAAKDTTE